MKVLEKGEEQKYRFLRRAGNKNQHIYDALAKLEVDQSLLIDKGEWKAKVDPAVSIASMTFWTKRQNYETSNRFKDFNGKKFSVRTLENNEGWIIRRVK